MADFFFTDTPDHNAVVDQFVGDGDTFHFAAGNNNDTIVVTGGGGEAEGRLGSGNDRYDASHSWVASDVHGGAGADTIIGSKANDHLFGDDGQDFLFGGYGDDTLNGGRGHNELTGGSGADTFVFDRDFANPYGDGTGKGVTIIKDYGCEDNPLQFNGFGSGLHWDKDTAYFLDGAGHQIEHLVGYEGQDMVLASMVGTHQEWVLA